MIKKLPTRIIEINSGESLMIYLKELGLSIVNWSGIPGPQNCIYLPDYTSFNWKKRDGIVRVNCKEQAKQVIETYTGKTMEHNGSGDTTREYSLLIDNETDLIDVITALKQIDGNSK